MEDEDRVELEWFFFCIKRITCGLGRCLGQWSELIFRLVGIVLCHSRHNNLNGGDPWQNLCIFYTVGLHGVNIYKDLHFHKSILLVGLRYKLGFLYSRKRNYLHFHTMSILNWFWNSNTCNTLTSIYPLASWVGSITTFICSILDVVIATKSKVLCSNAP